MSSTRHSALHRWSPLHPPLVRLAATTPQETATPDEGEPGDVPTVLGLPGKDASLTAAKTA